MTVLGSMDGDEQAIDAETLRFVGKYVTIDLTSGADRHLISVPARRLAHIVPRD